MDNQRQADEVSIEVLAGFFAGEGYIGIAKPHKKSKSPSLVVELGNSELEWVQIYKTRYGGWIRTRKPRQCKNAFWFYQWTIKDEKAAAFLREIYPFLMGEKKQQAAIALNLADIKASRPNRNVRGKLGHFDQAQIAAMNVIATKLRELRQAVAETKRTNALPVRNDSPTLQVIGATV